MKKYSSEWIVVIGLIFGLTARVHAQNPAPPPIDEFEQHYQAGASLYEAGWFLAAAERLQAAYRIHPMPTLLINIGQAFRKAGFAQQALSYYERFLQVEPNPPPDVRAEVASFIAHAQASLAESADNSLPEKMGQASLLRMGRFGYGLYVEGGGGPAPIATSHPDEGIQTSNGGGWFGSSHNVLLAGGGAYWTYRSILKVGLGVRGGRLIAIADNGRGDPRIIDILIPEICIATGRATWRWISEIGLTNLQACVRPLVSYIEGTATVPGPAGRSVHGWGGGVEGQFIPFSLRFGQTTHSGMLQPYVAAGTIVYPESIEPLRDDRGMPIEKLYESQSVIRNRTMHLAGYLNFGIKLTFEAFPTNWR